ncbi:MAG TPA: hypothetical protein PLO37_18210 [Candidatus Hydrogenedentes bacterium]|nr:hypothetical protein [Candidatus Hydrogenedentota bacterium]HPG68785.1 hypothetical protein [Candidatus Hydrogenedentota bacterium]
MTDLTKGSGHPRGCSRRAFLATAGAVAVGQRLILPGAAAAAGAAGDAFQKGPGAAYVPRIRAAFVRRAGDYGMRWPGAIYDGDAALRDYREQLVSTAQSLAVQLDLREQPIYSNEEADQWLAESEAQQADGLLLALLDRQEHAWPTATKAVDSPIPAVIFAPVGAAFTTNTAPLAAKTGAAIFSSQEFGEALFGLKMLKAGAKLRETRFVIVKGNERQDTVASHFGTKLRYVPAASFLEEYARTPESDEINAIADEYLAGATRVAGPTREDVLNGVKSFVVARTILEREEGDGISMDCLGALGQSNVSLPCIAWSRMLDGGVPAACEADVGACLTHAVVQYLFDRPGFQQDPVADTANDCLIGAHCTCATRLNGINTPPEPFHMSFHHGKRDAVPVPQWRHGQRVTVADILLSNTADAPPSMIISTGEVVDNVAVPPAGGCVVSVRIRLDNTNDMLAYPGFHQLFFYGDFKKELANYCKLYGIQAQLV